MLEDVKNYFANFDGTTNACRTVVLWVTIALLVAFCATRLYLYIAKRSGKYDGQAYEAASKLVNGGWIIAAITVAIAYIVTFAACYFSEVAHGEDALVPILFYPMLVLLIAVAASAITLFVKPTVLAKIVCLAVCGSALIAVIVCMIVYYASGDAGEALSNIGLYISAILLAVAVVAFAVLADRSAAPLDTRAITFAAVCIALSFALSYVRMARMPMGGSITLASMLPLMLFSYMFGSRKGVMAGAIFGVLQAIQDPWIIHPAQFALDYLVAFAAIGLTGTIKDMGLFKTNMRAQFALGATIACFVRFISHYFAGVFAFGMYGADYAEQYAMPALANEYIYSLVYQCMYIIPELAIVLVVSMLVLSSKTFRRQIEIYSAKKPVKQAPSENAEAN